LTLTAIFALFQYFSCGVRNGSAGLCSAIQSVGYSVRIFQENRRNASSIMDVGWNHFIVGWWQHIVLSDIIMDKKGIYFLSKYEVILSFDNAEFCNFTKTYTLIFQTSSQVLLYFRAYVIYRVWKEVEEFRRCHTWDDDECRWRSLVYCSCRWLL